MHRLPFRCRPGNRFGTRSGFTLIEVLAVVLIVGILAALLITGLRDAEDSATLSTTRNQISMLEGVLSDYENEFGDYPPSSFTVEQGVSNEGTNTGAEALVVALWSNGWEAGGHLTDDQLGNVDGDSAPRSLGDLGRSLLEVLDGWGNPIAYIHRRDYGADDRVYLTIHPETGEEELSTPKALKNSTTGRYFRSNRFQLISAGPDGRFGTEDDITNFERP